MKHFFILILVLGIPFSILAQDSQLQKGNVMVDVNTTFGAIGGFIGAGGGGTGFSLLRTDGTTLWNIGGEFGYFLADGLALKAGLGVGGFDEVSFVSYKVGIKYYAAQVIPLQLDISGQSIEDFTENPFYIGLQGGYAFFLGDMVSIEPTLRYNISTGDFFENVFIIQTGVSIFF